jgi:hypothetical protein
VNKSPSGLPVRKVSAGIIAGAITTIVVWALSTYCTIPIPDAVAAAITTLVSSVTSYLTRPGYKEGIPDDDTNAVTAATCPSFLFATAATPPPSCWPPSLRRVS